MKKILAIISVVLIIGFFIFGINYSNGVYSNFQADGYVLETNTNSKQYFLNNSEYKLVDATDTVQFVNSDNESKTISNDTFIHYTDGSVSVFKKSAVVDLSNMTQKSFQYYTVYSGSVFTKAGSDYKISYLDKQLSFSKFLIKISSDKYMIASPTLTIKVGNDEQVVKAGFIELTYSDGNIVKLQNQEINIQNISKDIRINIDDDTFISVGNKKIYYKNEEKINLGEITINSDDNIEIIQEESNVIIGDTTTEETKTGEEEKKDEEKKKKVIHQGDFEEVASGLVDAAEIEVETIVEENAAIKDAVFTVDEFDVTANSVLASVKVTDEESVLKGDLYIKIIKTSTYETVYYTKDSSGSNFVSVEVSTLTPQTNYILIMNRDYEKNGVTYNRDFIQKTFITSSLGMSMETDFVTSDEGSINVIKNNYSKVGNCEYILYDNTANREIDRNSLNFENVNSVTIDKDGLESNHEYDLIVYNFAYSNTIIDSEIHHTFKTLKAKPIISNTSFSVDKKNSKFVVYLNNIKDYDAGIVAYRVDVHLQSSNEFITSKTTSTSDPIEFNVDGELLSRNKHYNAYIYLIFNDNEKEYELPLGCKDVILEGYEGPRVTFTETSVTFEKISGKIEIIDNNNTIKPGEKVYVTYRNISIDDGTDKAIETEKYNLEFTNGKATILFDKNGFKRTSSYLFTVKAYVDYKESGEETADGYTLTDIASFIVNTKDPATLLFSPNNATSENSTYSFYLTGRLENYDTETGTVIPADSPDRDSLPAETMKSIGFMFYSVNYDKSTDCIPDNFCWTVRDYDDDPDDYVSTLKPKYYDQTFVISNEDIFDIDSDDIPYGQYYLELLEAYDYTKHMNKLDIVSERVEISVNNAGEKVINKQNPIEVKALTNVGGANPKLDETTQTGFQLKGILQKDVVVQSVTYMVFDANDVSDEPIYQTTMAGENGKVPTALIPISDLQSEKIRRGGSYYFKFSLEYVGANNPETSNKTKTWVVNKQEPQIVFYQSDRNEENVLFRYKLIDPDFAVKEYTTLGTKIYYYLDNNKPEYDSEASFVTLNRTEGNEERTAGFPVSNSTLHAYVKVKLEDNAEEQTLDLINYRFVDIISSYGNPIYSIINDDTTNPDNVDNAVVLKFLGLTNIQKNSLISADVKLTNTAGETKTLTDIKIQDNKIIIPYASITELKTLDEDNVLDISTEVMFNYDTNLYGVNIQDADYGLAIQKTNGTYIKFAGGYGYTVDTFDKLENKIKVKAFGGAATKEYDFYFNSGYITLVDSEDNETTVNFKKIANSTAECEGACTFWFSTIKPTINISAESSGVTTFSFYNVISGIEESDKDKLKIKVEVDKTNSNYGSPESFYTKEYNLADFTNKKITLSDLDVNSYYLVNYTYTIDGIHYHKFYFSNSSSGIYTSRVHTMEKLNIRNVRTAFQTKGNSLNERNLLIMYDISVTEGFEKVEYIVYNSANVEVLRYSESDATIRGSTLSGSHTATININGILPADDKYHISLRSYYKVNDVSTPLGDSMDNIPFSFSIREPIIKVSRSSDIVEHTFDIRTIVSDYGNALGSHKVYYVLTECNGVQNTIGSTTIGGYRTFKDIVCEGKTCDVKIVFEADFNNTGEYQQYESVTTIQMNPINMGTPVPVNNGSTTTIDVNFVGSIRINYVDTINYTIYDYSGEEGALNEKTSVSFAPYWNNTTTSINENLEPGVYYVVMQLYSEGDLVGNGSFNYVKG